MKKILTVVSCLLLTALVVFVKTEQVQAAKKTSKVQRLVKSKDIKEDDFFVDAKWLNKQMKDDDKTVVIEASYGEGKDYKKAHIPSALHIDTMEIETEESNWNILDAETCKEVFLKRGVTKTTPVVVYSSDINAAARVAFVAYWLGVDQVKILDGGLKAWEKADYKVEKGNEEATAAKDFGAEVPGRSEYLISTSDDLLASKEKNPDLVLASIRSWKEFTGKTSGYDYIENAGEPEGAVYAKSSKTSADVAQLMNNDGTVKEPTKIFSAWEKWGITPDKEVAFYCGTGWRAATAFFITKQEGWKDVRLFDGGWFDWDKAHQKDPSKYPVQVGDPRDKDKVEILN